jgi:hypothetical protein
MWAAPVSWSDVYARLQVLSRGVVDQKNRDFIASVLGREAAGHRVVERTLPALWRHQANISAPTAVNFT